MGTVQSRDVLHSSDREVSGRDCCWLRKQGNGVDGGMPCLVNLSCTKWWNAVESEQVPANAENVPGK